jgi:hypothetical protein
MESLDGGLLGKGRAFLKFLKYCVMRMRGRQSGSVRWDPEAGNLQVQLIRNC